VITWDTLLSVPYGASLGGLCAHPELVRDELLGWLYRTAPDQYLYVFQDPERSDLRYRGFAWVASEGVGRILFMRQGGTHIGPCDLPPDALLPQPGMLSAEAIAEYGLRNEPVTFRRHVNLTHQVSFGAFCYHYELTTPRPTDAPIAIEVDRDPDIHVPVI
jgi:hypothetical protein